MSWIVKYHSWGLQHSARYIEPLRHHKDGTALLYKTMETRFLYIWPFSGCTCFCLGKWNFHLAETSTHEVTHPGQSKLTSLKNSIDHKCHRARWKFQWNKSSTYFVRQQKHHRLCEVFYIFWKIRQFCLIHLIRWKQWGTKFSSSVSQIW